MSSLKTFVDPRPEATRPASELIGFVYDAAAEPSRWPSWFAVLATSLGHRASNLVIHGFGPTRYVCLDTPARGFETINPTRVFETKALSKQSFALAYVAGDFVEDWLRLKTEGSPPGGIHVFADVTRTLEPCDRALLREVLPHLHRALVLHFRLDGLEREQDSLSACLDEFYTGMLLLDTKARVLHANRAALDFLEGPYGLDYDHGKLAAPGQQLGEAFQRNLAAATSGRSRTMSGQPLPCGATLWLRGLGRDRAIAYIVSDSRQNAMAPELLADAFRLSPAQARVGSLFALGYTVDEIATRLDISVETVRLHVKKIQKKTGTHRQATLIRRMLETIPKVHP